MKKIEFYRHNIGEQEIKAVTETLQNIFITTGPKTRLFEKEFAAYLGAKHCIGVTSWTIGAFLVLKAWGIGPGDEVIVPAMTFIATPNVILHCGATPVFVDSERSTGNIDVNKIEEKISPRTKAIIPVHLYGQMADMTAIRTLAQKHGLRVLEDAAHCIEGTRNGHRPGHLSEAACFSFYATKNITCGEGGAIVTNDDELAEKLHLLRFHGMSKSAANRYYQTYQHWDMEILGYKANMTDIQASLLVPQLERIEETWKRKNEICRRYEEAFRAERIEFPVSLTDSKPARHLFTVWAPRGKRDSILVALQEKGIGVAVNFRAVHLLSFFRKHFGLKSGDFPVAEEIGDRTISIPMYPKLSHEEIEYILDTVIKTFQSKE